MGARGSAAAEEEEDSGAELVLARGSAALVGGGGRKLDKNVALSDSRKNKNSKGCYHRGKWKGGVFSYRGNFQG